jgi:PPOX class probable F420-dependent enzyme
MTAGTPLDAERYVSLETFRKNGVGVKTPVWAAPLDGKLVVFSESKAWKVKRLRNDPRMRVAGCNVNGKVIRTPWYDGTGRVVEDPAWIERAHGALRAKYGWQMRIGDVFAKLTGRDRKRAWIELTVG